MKKYIIMWDAGYGENYVEIEAENEKQANQDAYECCREEAESNANYKVLGEATDELRDEYL
jgi:hypothetical protein